ncbi:MAG: radical SAM protein [Bacilli bacterium]|nr:radical SAM protein [Bacilli bacterium]
MKILLLSGLGPSWPQGSAFYNSNMLEHTFLDKECYHEGLKRNISKKDFYIYDSNGDEKSLFRERNGIEKNLTTLTLEGILNDCDCEYEYLDLEKVWNNFDYQNGDDIDYIFLSTTFICNLSDLNYAINWCKQNLPGKKIIVGGQFSNLKYKKILEEFGDILYVMRGDGEIAIPALLDYLNHKQDDISKVPNLVWRNGDEVVSNEVKMVDVNTVPAIKLDGHVDNMYYESMRGCAFGCKFCSFPAASPKWRYKSAQKIADDWLYYSDAFGVKRMRAMDSAFTFPPKRLQELLELLKDKGIEWEAYSRADVINSKEVIEALEDANCRLLSFGFESLSDDTLKKMNKRVTAEQNRKTNELLNKYAKKLDYRCSFIVGFPGETPEEYQKTHDFLVNEYKKQFHLSVFSLVDETMPIWQEAEKYGLEVTDPNNPDYNWKHKGMTAEEARKLHQQTLYDVRWKNEFAVGTEWQLPFDLPLNPNLDFTKNYRIEKLIERLAFVTKDFKGNQELIDAITESVVQELSTLGVHIKGFSYNKEERSNNKALVKSDEK